MTLPDRIASATRHLDSAARSYAAGHVQLAALDLRLALEQVAAALVTIVADLS